MLNRKLSILYNYRRKVTHITFQTLRAMLPPVLPQLVVQGGVCSRAVVHHHRSLSEPRVHTRTGGAR